MSGFEVEGINKLDNDVVFDINVTPNRPDCLSIIGIAREISAILEIPLKSNPVEIQQQEGKGPEVEVKDTQLCRRYAGRLIRGVKHGPSPKWLINRLESHGFRTSCNIVDITNYVLIETGQPLHAFDLDKLTGQRIVVKTAGQEKNFLTLDNENRELNKDALLIWDADKPVALAGIMGGLNTEVSTSTVNILLESAHFNPLSIRRTSKSLGISTESSYRFERGIDINNVTQALDRAAQMISEIAGGRISGLTDVFPGPITPEKITVEYAKINSIIGAKIEKSFIEKTLNNLGFKTRQDAESIIVTPPVFRQDIKTDVDIIEEIARLYGYEKIPASLPNITMRFIPENRQHDLIKSIRNLMARSGFSEVINYSFFNPDVLDKLNLPQGDKRRNLTLVRNPLRKEESALRTTLLPSLLNNLCLNFNRGERMIRFFEISRVFFNSGQQLPHEVSQMAAIFHKEMTATMWEDRHEGFYDLKGTVEELLSSLKIKKYSFSQDPSFLEPYHHPGKSCSLLINGEIIGCLGMLHPAVLESFDIKDDISVLEIYDITKLLEYEVTKPRYSALPKFPYVERDIAIIVSREITFEQIEEEIANIGSALFESLKLFDVYTGKPIPPDKKSLAFTIRFRASDRTLKDEEVDSLHSLIVERLKNILGAELRS
jgi:phenylalanyl-tRNA synthetase beta chain